jgi:peptide/nickel transport system substrate-binding protein
MHLQVLSGTLTRRALLYRTAVGAASGLLATSVVRPAFAQLRSASAQTAAPRGELRIAVASFPNTLDALLETNVLRFGVGETLMRLTPTYELQPWLAERVENVDPLTWRISLRPNARFHDGSPVTAADVVEAFRRNYIAYPDGDRLISKNSRITALDDATVEIQTPQSTGVFPNALTSSNFIIHKPATPGGTDGTILTGPYRATRLTVDSDLVLEPFVDHWAGPPPIARITVKKVQDPNTEVLALQSGETDLIFRVPPEVVQGLGSDFTVASIPSGIVDSIQINFTRPPLTDHAVREALAWSIDRGVLVTLALNGQGAPATGVFPPNISVQSVAVQGYDLNRARQVLDDAGWTMGSDGVRTKGGNRLAFTLLNPDATQAELVPMSVSVQAQLKPLGFDVKLQQTQDYGGVIKSRDFDALIVSFNSVQTGDPLFQLARSVGKDGGLNWGSYSNPQIEDLLTQLRGELDPNLRQELSRQVQQVAGGDVPNVYLAVAPIVSAYRTSSVANFVPHPDDTYLIDSSLSVT